MEAYSRRGPICKNDFIGAPGAYSEVETYLRIYGNNRIFTEIIFNHLQAKELLTEGVKGDTLI